MIVETNLATAMIQVEEGSRPGPEFSVRVEEGT